jgi:hypothetical protein
MSSLVAGDVTPPRLAELDALRAASDRIRSGKPTDPAEIERTLEAGFAAMIALEAELSRLRPRATPRDEPFTDRVNDLRTRIAELSDALNELRTLAVRPGESRVGFGFVLPTPKRRREHT